MDGWARYQAAFFAQHLMACGGVLASAALRSLAAGRAGVGAMLKDLKTELEEFQEGLQSQQDTHADEIAYGAGDHAAAPAAADLAYYLKAVKRASQLGGVLIFAVRRGMTTDAGLTKEQRQFFKALRPKVQAVASGFLQALASRPPLAVVCNGVGAFAEFYAEDAAFSSLKNILSTDLLAVHAWVGLLVPCIQLAMEATLNLSGNEADNSARRIARQVLSCEAFAAVGKFAKKVAFTRLAPLDGETNVAATVTAALLPLIQCLCKQVLPSVAWQAQAEAGEMQQRSVSTEEDASATQQLSCRLSQTCPDLYEVFTALCGASRSCADKYLCRILMLDSLQSGTESCETAAGSLKDEMPNGKLFEKTGEEGMSSCEVFCREFLWLLRIPDVREVAEVKSACCKGMQLRLGGFCDWLALDPRRVNDTLDNFAFHAKAVASAAECFWETSQDRALLEMAKQQQRLLERALQLCSAAGGEDACEEIYIEPEMAPGRLRLCDCLTELRNVISWQGAAAMSADCTAYDVAYIVPYLVGRLSAACFALLWRWQRLLEEEQASQQQERLERDVQASQGGGEARAAPDRSRPPCAAEQARRDCGVAGAWLRSLEAGKKNFDKQTEKQEAIQTEACMTDSWGTGAHGNTATATTSFTTKRKREDVWEMDEFDSKEIEAAVLRVSTFLKTARQLGRLWRFRFPNRCSENGAETVDKGIARTLEAWGRVADDEDQWLHSFASGGGLQLLVMALGCPVSNVAHL